jgi:hypothetical protein
MNLPDRITSARNYRAQLQTFHDPMRVLTLKSTTDAQRSFQDISANN